MGHGGHDGGAHDVRLNFAASKAVPRHWMLWACVLFTCVGARDQCPHGPLRAC
jgi:hypothetical protein